MSDAAAEWMDWREYTESVNQVEARLAVIELALKTCKYDVEVLQKQKEALKSRRWNPCQQELHDRDMGWP